MVLLEDGFSDPPGIRVRPVSGLHGCDFLSEQPLVKSKSYVFGFLINTLLEVGYDTNNLDAMPYDWRLPPQKLSERDAYFIKLKNAVQTMHEINSEKVVLVAHSLGNRCAQYFLSWVQKRHGQEWIDQHVQAFLALGPPFLGAPKAVRAVISGDTMDLDIFLTGEEGRSMCRRCGSLPWLFPLKPQKFPDVLSRVKKSSDKGDKVGQRKSIKSQKSRSGVMEKKIKHIETNLESLVSNNAPLSWDFFKQFYERDPLYLYCAQPTQTPKVLAPPPVRHLWVIYGINLNTEVSFFYKQTATDKTRLILDQSADRYSGKKLALLNPRGLLIAGGIAFETKETYQPTIRASKSGDGTVPYCSLSLASIWKSEISNPNVPLKGIETIEIEGAEHRAMLTNEAVFEAVINLVCVHERPKRQEVLKEVLKEEEKREG